MNSLDLEVTEKVKIFSVFFVIFQLYPYFMNKFLFWDTNENLDQFVPDLFLLFSCLKKLLLTTNKMYDCS